MDIQVWRARVRKPAADQRSRYTGEPLAQAPADVGTAFEKAPHCARRIRLEAGSGRWLLVIDDAERARYARLIEDIRATLGLDECRFGTWSDSAEAGVGPEDWQAHGIRHVLVFGPCEEGYESGNVPTFVPAGELHRLAGSGQAKRALWQRLRPYLEA